MTNAIYKESKQREKSQKSVILDELKHAGSKGVLNTELNDIMLRFGQILYLLHLDGYKIRKENVGNGIVKYTLLNSNPAQKVKRESGLDIVKREMQNVSSNIEPFNISAVDLEFILESNNLQIIHKPNGLNKEVL